ncbi:hypothetical protein SFRURICE_016417 [Spodoptera frugiperda]|nr:hypothetical protein SFRURICE_016417 [Spodoptera frugiperda]
MVKSRCTLYSGITCRNEHFCLPHRGRGFDPFDPRLLSIKLDIVVLSINGGRGFDPFDPRLLSIKLDIIVLSINGLEVSPLSHCI